LERGWRANGGRVTSERESKKVGWWRLRKRVGIRTKRSKKEFPVNVITRTANDREGEKEKTKITKDRHTNKWQKTGTEDIRTTEETKGRTKRAFFFFFFCFSSSTHPTQG
jgi:hypothetical protein